MLWLAAAPNLAFAAPPTSVASAERSALLDLALATNVSGWVRSKNWLSDQSVCAWELVGCDEQGRVKTLSLSFNSMVGTLPASLGAALTRLEALDVEGNHLHGSVPSSLGQPATLVQIGLGVSNQFSGDLPETLCPTLRNIVQAAPPHVPLSCDLGGPNDWTCPLPCPEAALCGANCTTVA